ncbi:hypothetical protein AB0L75_16415 [Streptomyces sp. NPDC052101]|uniref:hypothetical protein n=1 Tax=Streptomyces sp. NPDC052101 TaxID=3155763 RepID=UPI00341876E2
MNEWSSPQHAAAVAAYQAQRDAGGHVVPPRSKWRARRHRCSGGVVVVDQATGTPYTLPCTCPSRPEQ